MTRNRCNAIDLSAPCENYRLFLTSPLLNPMHPPLAKELMAVSIRVFGDVPLGWRYPSVLFGSLAIVAIYLCGLALFTAQGPAVASALIAFFNQMVFVQSRIPRARENAFDQRLASGI